VQARHDAASGDVVKSKKPIPVAPTGLKLKAHNHLSRPEAEIACFFATRLWTGSTGFPVLRLRGFVVM